MSCHESQSYTPINFLTIYIRQYVRPKAQACATHVAAFQSTSLLDSGMTYRNVKYGAIICFISVAPSCFIPPIYVAPYDKVSGRLKKPTGRLGINLNYASLWSLKAACIYYLNHLQKQVLAEAMVSVLLTLI